eukprot:4917124-Prorocentrum_lima.AAC.1
MAAATVAPATRGGDPEEPRAAASTTSPNADRKLSVITVALPSVQPAAPLGIVSRCWMPPLSLEPKWR